MQHHIFTSTILGSLVLCASAAAQKDTLTTNFASNNSLTSGGTQHFDIEVKRPGGIVICELEVNCENATPRNGPVGTDFEIDIYLTARGGTHVGNQGSPAGWTLHGTGEGVSLIQGTPTPVDITDIFIPTGKYGMAINYRAHSTKGGPGTAFAYTNGNGTNQTVTNNDIELKLGTSQGGLFTGGVFSPRVWNGSIIYEAGTNAAFGSFGVGCDGGAPQGAPTLGPGAGNPLPILSVPLFDLEASNLPSVPSAFVLVIGVDFATFGNLSLPADMGSLIGAPGCPLYVSPDILFFGAHAGIGTHSFLNLPVPNFPGLNFGAQLIVNDAGSSVGVTATNMAAGQIGN